MSFDKNSSDSMFSAILERLEGQDTTLARIEAQTSKTNGRVSRLEVWRGVVVGAVLALSTVIGWYVVWSPKK